MFNAITTAYQIGMIAVAPFLVAVIVEHYLHDRDDGFILAMMSFYFTAGVSVSIAVFWAGRSLGWV